MKEIIGTLKSFNSKVERLERSGFSKRFSKETPEVLAKFESGSFNYENLGEGQFTLVGKIKSWVPVYNEDEIDAFILTYRMLTQNNDRVSISRLSEIYNLDWFPEEGKNYFNEARKKVNEYLDSPATITFKAGWISIRSIMDIIIYGGLAHTDTKKEKLFNSWINSGMSGFFQVAFMAALKFMLSYFTYFKELNEVTIKLLEDKNFFSESTNPRAENRVRFRERNSQ